MWDDQFAALAARHRVIRYDLRGFGRSSLPTGPYVHADDCVAPSASGRLAEVRAPTLLLTGQRDIEDVQTQARLLERGITGLRSVTLPGVGHMSNMEAPAAVNRALLDFLA
jgi:pimeloyl-ACP methyl ester carboxylesterase